jgi:hypothetical protein
VAIVTTFIDWLLSDLKPRFKQSTAVRPSSNIMDDFGVANNNEFEEMSAPVRKVSNIGGGSVGLVKKALQEANQQPLPKKIITLDRSAATSS